MGVILTNENVFPGGQRRHSDMVLALQLDGAGRRADHEERIRSRHGSDDNCKVGQGRNKSSS